jgi:hypothetical protein
MEFEQEIKKSEEQRMLNEMKDELVKLKKIAGAYKASNDDSSAPVNDENIMERLEAEGEVDVMQLLADN